MSKLDRFKFAQLCAFIAKRCTEDLEQEDIGHLDWLTESVPVELDKNTVYNEINAMFDALIAGKKIEAIKCYKDLTDCNLIDSKNAIEALQDRIASKVIYDFKCRLIDKIKKDDVVVANNLIDYILDIIKDFK